MLEDKVVVVTGGSSGIGRGVALAAARHRARHVIIGDLTEKAREGPPYTAALLSELGTGAQFMRANVTRQVDMEDLLAAAEDFGGVD